jgi:hypothetical protein
LNDEQYKCVVMVRFSIVKFNLSSIVEGMGFWIDKRSALMTTISAFSFEISHEKKQCEYPVLDSRWRCYEFT